MKLWWRKCSWSPIHLYNAATISDFSIIKSHEISFSIQYSVHTFDNLKPHNVNFRCLVFISFSISLEENLLPICALVVLNMEYFASIQSPFLCIYTNLHSKISSLRFSTMTWLLPWENRETLPMMTCNFRTLLLYNFISISCAWNEIIWVNTKAVWVTIKKWRWEGEQLEFF